MEAKSLFWKKVFGQCSGGVVQGIEHGVVGEHADIRGIVGKINLYDPTARAGVGIFTLPADHWLTNAARPHDAWYDAKERGELPVKAKGRADVVFFNMARIDAEHELQQELTTIALHDYPDDAEWDAYNRQAERLTQLALAYLAIRGPIGELAWRT